jgi:hypothetical protein
MYMHAYFSAYAHAHMNFDGEFAYLARIHIHIIQTCKSEGKILFSHTHTKAHKKTRRKNHLSHMHEIYRQTHEMWSRRPFLKHTYTAEHTHTDTKHTNSGESVPFFGCNMVTAENRR